MYAINKLEWQRDVSGNLLDSSSLLIWSERVFSSENGDRSDVGDIAIFVIDRAAFEDLSAFSSFHLRNIRVFLSLYHFLPLPIYMAFHASIGYSVCHR